jgi:hypothetical protein
MRLMLVTSIQPQSEAGRSKASESPASCRSRIQDERVFRHALKYRWNCRLRAGTLDVLRHVNSASPVRVRLAGSSRAVIV